MIRKILARFGYVPQTLVRQLEDELADQKMKILKLEQKKVWPLPVVEVEAKDPAPSQVDARKAYVARAAAYHVEVLRPKLLQLIADARAQFEQLNRETFGLRPEEYDWILKGTLNGLWLLHGWGEDMVNEQVSYQQEEPSLTVEETQELKDKLKN